VEDPVCRDGVGREPQALLACLVDPVHIFVHDHLWSYLGGSHEKPA